MSVKRKDLLQGTQLDMFSDGQDTPLFSGTPQRASVKPFEQHATARQSSMAECPVCLDTGRVSGKYCTCSAGQRARDDDRREREAEQYMEWQAGIR